MVDTLRSKISFYITEQPWWTHQLRSNISFYITEQPWWTH